jgi:glycerate kinase
MGRMRVLLAPDCFGGTLTAVEAARAMAAGWRAWRPDDQLVELPLSDGGPGFLATVPGHLHALTVEDPLARPVLASWKLDGTTGYVEVAQACGLHLLTDAERDATTTTSYGVGQLVKAAVDAGATRVVLGLGGTATNDAGAGMLAALGIRREDESGEPLAPGGLALARARTLVGQPIQVSLVAATDVDAPLLGRYGASVVFGPQKGASPEQVELLEQALAHWVELLEAHLGVSVRDLPGAGAAGGIGSAVLALGGTRESGLQLVADLVGLAGEVQKADLVLTGEGSFDVSSLRGKVVSGVAAAAQREATPCVVLAGRVSVGRRERAAAGIEEAYSLEEEVGLEQAMAQPAESLATLAGRVAQQWGV